MADFAILRQDIRDLRRTVPHEQLLVSEYRVDWTEPP